MKLKLSFRNHLQALMFHLIGTIVMIIIVLIFEFQRPMLLSFGLFWLMLTIPTLYLHVQYYLENRGLEVEILSDALRVKNRSGVRLFKFEEIKKVIQSKSASLDKGGMPMTPLEFTITSKSLTLMGRNW